MTIVKDRGTDLPQPSTEAEPNREEFRDLFERLYGAVFNYFRRNGQPPESCEDLAQETFLRAFRGLPSFRAEAKPDTWLFRIARNVLHNAYRDAVAAKRKGHELPLDAAPGLSPAQSVAPALVSNRDPLDGTLAVERLELVRDALHDLPPRMRGCVILRLAQGLTYREIATVMQLSIGAVKAHLSQGKKRLQDQLARGLDGVGAPRAGDRQADWGRRR